MNQRRNNKRVAAASVIANPNSTAISN